MIGQAILHYRIEKKLGEGGMGEVFLATDTRLDYRIAVTPCAACGNLRSKPT